MAELLESAPLVLVVEDNPINAKLAGGMLAGAGYRVAFAADGDEGFRLTRELLPVLVITDLQMPGTDGLAMLRLLKADAATRDIPVAVLTAHAMQDHRDRAVQAGCCSFITKPIRYQPFIAEVARVLQLSLTGAGCDA